MTPEQLAALQTELQNAKYGGLSDGEQSALLNTPGTETVPRGTIPAAQFYKDLAALRIPIKVKRLADTLPPVTLRDAQGQIINDAEGNPVTVAVDELKQSLEDLKSSDVVGTSDATVLGFLGAGVFFGVIDASMIADLTTTKVSKAEVLLGRLSTTDDVSYAHSAVRQAAYDAAQLALKDKATTLRAADATLGQRTALHLADNALNAATWEIPVQGSQEWEE